MMLLCVDGIDPDLVQEYGWGKMFKFNYKLEIPRECFIPDPEVGETPHTTRVWPTIFSGEIIDYGLIKREGLRKKAHDVLVRAGITWKGKPKYRLAPGNEERDTILDHYESFAWNIPTICPEWIATFPSYEAFSKYCNREYRMYALMIQGARQGIWEIDAYYLRWLDYMGHNNWKALRVAYQSIFMDVSSLKKKRDDVILLSDHGCKEGVHTNYAYLGSDVPILAESVHELRHEFERILDGPLNEA